MNVVLRSPDDIAASLTAQGADLEREALEASAVEAFAAEAHRAGRLARFGLRTLLGIETGCELDGFLKKRGVEDGASLWRSFARSRLRLPPRRPQSPTLRLAVADTGPIDCVVLIGEIRVLPALVERLLVPDAVAAERDLPGAPPAVRAWTQRPPVRLRGEAVLALGAQRPAGTLHPGVRAAIALARGIAADALLADDRAGAAAARARGLRVFGTLGVLQLAARDGLLDLPGALGRLLATHFHIRREIVETLLAEDRARRDAPGPGARNLRRTAPAAARRGSPRPRRRHPG